MEKIFRESMSRKFLFFVSLIIIISFVFCVTLKEYEVRAGEATKIVGDDGAEMVLVPAGEFIMGRPENEKRVYLNAYYIDKYEVTVGQFNKFVKETGYVTTAEKLGYTFDREGQYRGLNWRGPGYKDYSDKHPVTCVSGEDVEAYCKWAGKRLPTGAEWEKAARGTDGRKYPWGNKIRYDTGNFISAGSKPKGPVQVGLYPRGVSPYGCHDMAGNLYEWCIEGSGCPTSAPYSARGGSFYTSFDEKMLLTYIKMCHPPNYTSKHCYTFRCVKSE